jgi:transposase, IS5 family
MIVDRYDPINLFELVPKLNLQFEPELAHLDRLLDDDELFNLLKADLLKRAIPTQEGSVATPRPSRSC